MIKIIDTYSQINSLFENGMFIQAKWESYINSIYDNSAHFFIGDLNECLDSGNYDYKKDVLSVLNAVYNNPNACEIWSKEIGCKEFASDCELENLASFKFHMAMGFEEANRIICFRKML